MCVNGMNVRKCGTTNSCENRNFKNNQLIVDTIGEKKYYFEKPWE